MTEDPFFSETYVEILDQRAKSLSERRLAHRRDRFARAALSGLMANPSLVDYKRDYLAARAWEMADLMLQQRDKE